MHAESALVIMFIIREIKLLIVPIPKETIGGKKITGTKKIYKYYMDEKLMSKEDIDKIIDKNPYNEIDFLESHSKVNVFRPKVIDKNSSIGSDKDIGRIYIDIEETEENKKMEYCKGPISHNSLYGDANIVEIADAYSLFKKIMNKEENKDQKEFYQSIKVLPPNEELKKEANE